MHFELYILTTLVLLVAASLSSALKVSLEIKGAYQYSGEFQRYPGFYFLFLFMQQWEKESKGMTFVYWLGLYTLILRLIYAIFFVIVLVTSTPLSDRIVSEKLLFVDVALVVFAPMLILLVSDLLLRLILVRQTTTSFKFLCLVNYPFYLILFPLTYPIVLVHNTFYRKKLPFVHDGSFQEKVMDFIHDIENIQVISSSEKNLLISMASFRKRIVREIMTPRIDVFALDGDSTVKDCREMFREEGYSRVPVFEGNIDNIIGVLLYKDVLDHFLAEDIDVATTSIKNLCKPALFTPETKKVSHLLQEFKTKQSHMAIVVDEYGGTEGIVTIEDILEELVGDIEDEHDDDDDDMFISEPEGGWIVDAKMTLLDVEKDLHISIPQAPDYETIGGYIFTRAGAIPSNGWRIHHDTFYIEVVSSDEKSIEKVKIIPINNSLKTAEESIENEL